MTREDARRLLALVRAALEAPPQPIESDPESLQFADWPGLLESARRHRLSSLLFEGAHRLELGGRLPEEARNRLAAAYHATLARNTVLLHHAERLAAAAFISGCPLVLLKGAAFANGLYTHPALRPMTDVDLLAREEDLPRLVELAAKLGYQSLERTDHALCLKHGETQTYLELHTSLTSCPRYIGLETESLVRRSKKTHLGNVPVRSLSPEDHLLHLSLHASFQHGLRQPAVNACDAFLLAQQPRFDWTGFLARASAPRLAPLVAAGLALSHTILPHRKLCWALETLSVLVRPRQRAWIGSLTVEDLLAPSPEAVSRPPWSRLRWTSRLRDRAALIGETLRPHGSGNSALTAIVSRSVVLLRRHGPAWWARTIAAQRAQGAHRA